MFSNSILNSLFYIHRYALDVNVERAEDVLTHQRLLKLAEDPATRPVFEVRCVQVWSFNHLHHFLILLACFFILPLFLQVSPTLNGNSGDVDPSDPAVNEDAQSSYNSRSLAPPTFGSSPNFEALTQAYKDHAQDDDSAVNAQLPNSRWDIYFWHLTYLSLLVCIYLKRRSL